MPSDSEIVVARCIRRGLGTLPQNAVVREPEAGVCNGFEYFIPPLLGEAHRYWKNESFDGLFAAKLQKRGNNTAEIVGNCILISDQTVTPFHVRIEISPSAEEVIWMECRVGAPGNGAGGMKRVPFSEWQDNHLINVPDNVQDAKWVYSVTFGVKSCFIDWS